MKHFLFIIILVLNYALGQLPLVKKKGEIKINTVLKPQHDPPIIINSYTAVTSFDVCENILTVADASAYTTGDTVLLIQMQGAVTDTSGNSTFGTITSYENAGNYEMNFISAITGNKIILRNTVNRKYDIPNGKVQLIRMPYIKQTNYNGEFTCKAWDGNTGGVLVLNASFVNILDDIEVSGTGFRPGQFSPIAAPFACFENGYAFPVTYGGAAIKGDGIAAVSQNKKKGKGSVANGGGGGVSNKSGGGGGGNGGKGGNGGYQSDTCGGAPFDNRGGGGNELLYTSAANKIFMGGGGGNGYAETEYTRTFFGDGAGGGIVIIVADSIAGNGLKIIANGGNGAYCSFGNCSDGMDGGGAGGTVVLFVNKIIDNLIIETKGGKGADMAAPVSIGGRTGPGGGGGGGVFFLNQNTMPANVTSINTGGAGGVIILDSNNPWGAAAGADGKNIFNLPNPFSTVLFKPNIDSVKIQYSPVNCTTYSFTGLGYTNTNPVQSWLWNFEGNGAANAQNVFYSYNTAGIHPIKLIVTDINGCKDSAAVTADIRIATVDAGTDKYFCADKPVSLILNATGNGTGAYKWHPAVYLNDSTLQNPTALVSTTTTFYVVYTDNACSVTDSVRIIVNPNPLLNVSKSNDVNCALPVTRLLVSGAQQYIWSPATMINNPLSNSPIANPVSNTVYKVTGTDSNGCAATDSIFVKVDFSINNIRLPNAFTPNHDGLNDCFGLKYYTDVRDYTFKIYNRYGELVFKTSTPGNCWDGIYKDRPSDAGSYIYYVNAVTLCGTTTLKGTVLLVR